MASSILKTKNETLMEAAICTKYGSPDVMEVRKVEKPVPGEQDVLIRISESLLSITDVVSRQGNPFIIRLMEGFLRPKQPILGSKAGGVVEAVGAKVKRFKVGDLVFGNSHTSSGAHGEYFCLPEDAIMALKPRNMSIGEACALSYGAFTSLTFLRDTAALKPGQKILINGASGSVGTFAVQLAKYYGAEVTGVCSGVNLKLVKSLGADKVIDYTTADFAENGSAYDVIFDVVGKNTFTHCKPALKANGLYLTTVPTFGILFQMLWTAFVGDKRAKFVASSFTWTQADLDDLVELGEAGELRAVIDRRYPLAEIAEAHAYVETERQKGSVLIKMGEE